MPLICALIALPILACSHGAAAPDAHGEPIGSRMPPPGGASGAPGVVPSTHILLMGDYGKATPQRDAVTAGVFAENARAPFDLVLMPGDNIYECGPDAAVPAADRCVFRNDNAVDPAYVPPADPLFDAAFEKPLAPLARRDGSPTPVYLTLGNHDINAGSACLPPGATPAAEIARRKACLEVAHRGPHWTMPGRHYVVDFGPARIIAFDSNLLVRDYGGFTFERELDSIRTAAEGCGGRFCFLMSHHPPVTAGLHADEASGSEYLARVARIEEAGHFDAWLAGHDHDLQHLRLPSGYDVLVSGNGSKARDEPLAATSEPGAQKLFASDSWGFAVMDVAPGRWSARFEDPSGKPLHCCSAAWGGHCDPVPCGG